MTNKNNSLHPEDSLEIDNDQAMTPKKLNALLRGYGAEPTAEVQGIPPELEAEMMDISKEVKSLAEVQKEEQRPRILPESDLSMKEVHKIFSVDRMDQGYEAGPRNFFDHSMNIEIHDQFKAPLMANKNPDMSNVASIRKELHKLDQDDQNRIYGRPDELNKAAYDVMKKTHDDERRTHPGNVELHNQHELERDYFKARLVADEKDLGKGIRLISNEQNLSKKDLPELNKNVLTSAQQYFEDNPKVAEEMSIGASFLENSTNKSNWKHGLRDFFGKDEMNEKQQFEAESNMLSIHKFNLRNASKEERETLAMQMNVEQTYFDYNKQKHAFAQDPSPKNSERLEERQANLVELMKEFDGHLTEKNQVALSESPEMKSEQGMKLEPNSTVKLTKENATEQKSKYTEEERNYHGHRLPDEVLDICAGITNHLTKGSALSNVNAMRMKATQRQ